MGQISTEKNFFVSALISIFAIVLIILSVGFGLASLPDTALNATYYIMIASAIFVVLPFIGLLIIVKPYNEDKNNPDVDSEVSI